MENLRQKLFGYAREKWGTVPEYLFASSPDTAILRHAGSKKWYAAFLTVPADRLGIKSAEKIDIIDLKCDPLIAGALIAEKKAFPGYHMNKAHWITVLLDGSVRADEIYPLMEISHALTQKPKRSPKKQ